MEEKLLIVGVNHRTAPVAVRERLAYGDGEIVSALARLKGRAPALAEAALISTCNRVEIIGVAADPARAIDEAVSHTIGGNEAAGLRKDDEERGLAEVGGFAAHVGAGDEEQIGVRGVF